MRESQSSSAQRQIPRQLTSFHELRQVEKREVLLIEPLIPTDMADVLRLRLLRLSIELGFLANQWSKDTAVVERIFVSVHSH